MGENEVGESILGCALKVHKALGPGLLENAYEACLAYEMGKAGMRFARQVPLPVIYDGVRVEVGYRIDLLIEDIVVVEVKAVDQLTAMHRAQLLSYLKLGNHRLGYLLNFNVRMTRDGICRLANGL